MNKTEYKTHWHTVPCRNTYNIYKGLVKKTDKLEEVTCVTCRALIEYSKHGSLSKEQLLKMCGKNREEVDRLTELIGDSPLVLSGVYVSGTRSNEKRDE